MSDLLLCTSCLDVNKKMASSSAYYSSYYHNHLFLLLYYKLAAVAIVRHSRFTNNIWKHGSITNMKDRYWTATMD